MKRFWVVLLSAVAIIAFVAVRPRRAKAYTYWSVQNPVNWASWTVNSSGSCQAGMANGTNPGEIDLGVTYDSSAVGNGAFVLQADAINEPFGGNPIPTYEEITYSANNGFGYIGVSVYQQHWDGMEFVPSETDIAGGTFSAHSTGDTITFRQNGGTQGVYANGGLVLSFATPSIPTGGPYYGIVSCTTGSGSGIANVSLGPTGGYPQAIQASQIGVSAYSNAVDLQWPAAVESDSQVPILEYLIYRNGTLIGTTSSLSYSDTTVSSYTNYSYTLTAEDVFFNTASTNFNVSTPPVGPPEVKTQPPYPSSTPDGRRVGVRPTGAYWGASGENIDVLTGNLSFSQPLLKAQSRGWGVPFNLVYNSQNWRKDSGGTWEFNADVGVGYGWRVNAGAIEPVYTGTTVSYYIYIDATGAEYRLSQQNGVIWTSPESAYVWWDSYGDILHFRDGSFWNFQCVSASNQPDAGFMYPTLMEDSNGNQIKITYKTAPGSSWTNSTARINTIEDVRGDGSYTYQFHYNSDSPVPHLTSISNTIGTGEAYTFSYNSNQTLYDPFQSQAKGTTAFLSRITLNIGTYYQFSTNGSGELTQIQLPYKGTLNYNYVTTNYGDGRSFREINLRTLSTCNSLAQGCEAGTGQYAISHESSPGWDIHQYALIEDPGGVGEKYWAFNSSGTYEGLATTYQGRDRGAGGPGNCLSGSTTGSGKCLVESDFTWSLSSNNSYISQALNTQDPGAGYQKQTTTTQTVDGYGNVTQAQQYNYSGMSPSVRTTTTTYLNASNYTSRYIFNRVASSSETDGTYNTSASVTYDCGNGCIGAGSTPTPQEWDTAYQSIGWRGDPTTVTVSGIQTNSTYDMYGNVVSGTGSNGVTTTASVTSTTNYAAPSQVTVGNLTTSLTYGNLFLGLTNETGPNGTNVSLGYDANARPTTSTSPFGATTTTSYNDTASPPNSCTVVDGRWTQTNLDGLGRAILVVTGAGSSCGQGTTVTQAETTYGACGCSPLGKMISQAVSHAYNTSPAASTIYTYDGVGRTVSKAAVGNDTQGTTTYSYQGNAVTVTDPATKWKTFTTDGFGNLVTVTEPNPAGGSNLVSTYTYDVQNRLRGVSMTRSTGTQTRSFVYTGNLLTSTTNPENGTVTYTYDPVTNQVATRTDAKGQVTKYSYDSYARLSKVQRYPQGLSQAEDTCQQEDYYYDGANPLNSNYPQNASGKLSAVEYWGRSNPSCDTEFNELYTYSTAGAPTGKELFVTRNETPWIGTYTIQPMTISLAASFSYDTEGRLTQETYPTDKNGATASVSYTFDSMGRLYGMTNNLTSQPIINGATYGPANELLSINGVPCCNDGWRGETRTYNSLKQLISLTSADSPQSVRINYNYPSTGNNGKISSQTDVNSGETVTYTYDSLNRLATAATQSGFNPSWGQSFTYDGFGNLTNVGVTQGSAPTFTASYDQNNHAGGEDANGNPTSVPLPAYGTSGYAGYDVEKPPRIDYRLPERRL